MQLKHFVWIAFFVASTSFAAEGGGAGFVPTKYEAYLSSGYIGIGSGSKQFDIAPGFQYQIWQPWLQVGAEITYQKISYQSGSASNMIFQVGPTANYESIIISLGLALKSSSAGDTAATSSAEEDDPNGFGYYFMVGKHFVLFPGFSLRPTLGIVATGNTSLVIRPFALSYNF